MVRASRVYLPALAAFLLAVAAVALCFFQETDLLRLVGFLRPDTAYLAASVLFLLYVLFAWPLSVDYLRRRYRHAPHGLLRYYLTSLSAPLGLFGLLLPLLIAGTFYKGLPWEHCLALGMGWLAVAFAVVMAFRLGFFVPMRLGRIYFAVIVFVTAGLPALDLVLHLSYGMGLGPFLKLNPFHFLILSLEESLLFDTTLFRDFVAAWVGLGLALASAPFALGRPSVGSYEILSFTQNET